MLTLIARTRKLSSSKLQLLTHFSPLLQSTATDHFLSLHHQIQSNTTSPTQAALFFSSLSRVSAQGKQSLTLTREGNYDDSTLNHAVCPGCGVGMQESDPKLPGFFSAPIQKSHNYRLFKSHLEPISQVPEFSNSLKRGVIAEPEDLNPPAPNLIEKPVVCARCHSLRHYGKVKDSTIENLLPDFDFDHTVGRKLVSVSGTRSVVLMVVDASDFDGSFPKKVARLVSDTIEENSTVWKKGQSGNVPRVVLVVTKIDLLPSKISPTGFEHWVRRRAKENGMVKVTSLHLVSAVRDWGLKNLVDDVISLAGPRGNVWAVGAQNAGKSTLINAIGKLVSGGENVTHLTEAPVPGTTLGILRVEGILPGKAKLFDTPGLLNPHQITTRLTREEQRLVYVSKELKLRTYRIKVGQSVHIAGLMRLDVEELSVDTIYITVWASPYLPLHMGKTENAETMIEDHFGHQLQPPIGQNRVKELGKWVRKEFPVTGENWDLNSVDIAASGLGWFSVGLKGEAVLGVWTYEGVDVTLRNSLVPYRSRTFEVAGFTVSKIVSRADQSMNKSRREAEKKVKQGLAESSSPSVVDKISTSSLMA